MFLHEPGEDGESYSRHDLSLLNASSSNNHPAPPPHRGPPVAAAQPMNRQDSNETNSPTGGGDVPALPATANWGNKATQERRASRSTNASNPSPMTTNA